MALGGEVGQKARLRENENVGGRARFRVDHGLLLIVLGRGILDLGTGGLAEIFEHHLHMGFVITAPGSENRQGFTLQVNLLQVLEVLPVEGAFARLVLEIGGECGGGKSHGKQCSRDGQTQLHHIPPCDDLCGSTPERPGGEVSKALWMIGG
jgi:hypothetical protein